MLFKCVLYYILTAINFIRLFIRAVFHRGVESGVGLHVFRSMCRRREPLKNSNIYKSPSHPHQVKATPSLYHLSFHLSLPPRFFLRGIHKRHEYMRNANKS